MVFNKFLKEIQVVLFDGAMGTELARRGLEMSAVNNISNPEHVLEIHREYIKAGADALITNTFSTNRISMELHGLNMDIDEVNLAAVRLARQAAENGQFVFGDIASTGKLLEPYGEYTEGQFYRNFKEQAAILARGGVDGLIVETMMDLREAVCALKACKDAANLPVIISLTFATTSKGGRTAMGNSAAEIAMTLEKQGADVIGANCGDLDPGEMAKIAEMYKEATALPVMVQPNAGKPVLVNNQAKYEMKPEQFADGLMKCIDSDASIIGGCCGTTPDHIRAVAEKIKDSFTKS